MLLDKNYCLQEFKNIEANSTLIPFDTFLCLLVCKVHLYLSKNIELATFKVSLHCLLKREYASIMLNLFCFQFFKFLCISDINEPTSPN